MGGRTDAPATSKEAPLHSIHGRILCLGLACAAGGSAAAQAPTPAPAPSASPAPSPPATDIFLLDARLRGGSLDLGKPVRITERAGYDNQPAFSPDGRTLYFTAIADGRADIQRYDLNHRQATAFAQTPESEYSPTPAPGGGLSVVRVETDGTQRLWRFPAGGDAELLLPDVKPVGYHAWADPDTLVLFVLGDPPTLQVAQRSSGRAQTVARDVGRCLRPVPGRRAVSFVEKASRTEWWLAQISFPERTLERIARLPEGVEDYAWLPDRRVVAGQGGRLLELPPGGREWRELVRFDDPALQHVTRLAASAQGDRLALVSDEAPASALTVDGIMRGPDLVGYAPSGLRWSGDSKDLYFEWRKPGEDEPATWTVPRAGGEPRRLSDAERKLAPSADCRWDAAQRLCLFVENGDIALVDTVARRRRHVTRTTATESGPRFALRETAVTFVRDDNLFRAPLGGDEDVLVQLTSVGARKKEPKLTDSQRFLRDEERKLLRHADEAAARKKRAEDKKEREEPPRFEITEGQSVPEAALSEDGRFAYLLVARKARSARTADVPSYVTESAYAEMIPTRANVGDRQETRRLAILDLQERKRVWAWVDGVTQPEPEPPEKLDGPEGPAAEDDPAPAGRALVWGLPEFSRDGGLAVAAARAVDNKDRWLVLLDPVSGKGRVVDHQHDDAWVREPFGTRFGWIEGRRLWFLSEASGFQHLYTVDAAAGSAAPRAITSGEFEVTDVSLAARSGTFYLTTTQADAGERHVYRVPAEGGALTRLTRAAGAHRAEVSPDEATLGELFSTSRTPPEVFVTPSRPEASGRQVTISTRPEFRTHKWIAPPVVRFKARDGAFVPARLFTPESVGAAREPRRPGVVFIHGAGYLQNAHHYWSQYYREYMFHHLLASRGYVVLDVDYRGSAGYGRNWRTAIAGHMGGKDLLDVLDGAQYLVQHQGVDAGRIGVYGGSYGGFLTLMAMFTAPGTFAAGAALRPVTDWAHYNHPYTSNILGTPPKDAEAFRRSSPIYFAEGLRGALLICHGMVDTNVHFQDSVRLAQRLIELRKENWELAAYPVENHAFEEATSWADEYKRILALFERTLRSQGD